MVSHRKQIFYTAEQNRCVCVCVWQSWISIINIIRCGINQRANQPGRCRHLIFPLTCLQCTVLNTSVISPPPPPLSPITWNHTQLNKSNIYTRELLLLSSRLDCRRQRGKSATDWKKMKEMKKMRQKCHKKHSHKHTQKPRLPADHICIASLFRRQSTSVHQQLIADWVIEWLVCSPAISFFSPTKYVSLALVINYSVVDWAGQLDQQGLLPTQLSTTGRLN